MTEASAPEKKSGRFRLALIALAACGVLGGVAGFGLPILLGSASAEEGAENPELSVSISELPVGRITVALAGGQARGRHLVLDAIVEYDAAKISGKDAHGASGLDSKHAHIRDAFIEYLSQVSENEITGSAGMANLRSELLRRARAVTGTEAPRAILIQDYILQ